MRIFTFCLTLCCLLANSALSVYAADPAPFAANLFQGHFSAETKPVLQPGDRLVLRLWGPVTFDGVLSVDADGFVDIPGAGRLPVAGLPQDPPELLEKAIASKLRTVPPSGDSSGSATANNGESGVYVRPMNTQPVTVMVTGFVPKPGSYAGSGRDTILSFLDKAGGIDPKRGTYRHIKVMRAGRELGDVDLYPFVLRGELTAVRFQDGDTIVVGERGPTVAVAGDARNPARFEFAAPDFSGADLLDLAIPLPGATHASLTGTRSSSPYNLYLPLTEFRTLRLAGGDQVRFQADKPGDTITIEAQGAVRGGSRIPVRRNAKLRDVLAYIAVDPDRANLDGLHIKRKSVAARQKKAIEDSLRRLEQNAYTATSASAEEAQIRAKEAEMLTTFISKAREAEPEGVVVVGKARDLAMEDGDIIVIPEKNDVVLINGEVMMPQALIWDEDKDMDDYIQGAGGFTNRANTGNILVLRPGGEVVPKAKNVLPGDQVLVLPAVESKTLQAVKDVSQVLYQIAVACKVIVDL